jgi:hypothetical protein
MARGAVSLLRVAVLSTGLALFGSSFASAQTPAPGSIPLFARQLQGKNVWITADGVRVRGRVASLSSTGLALVEDGAPTTIPYDKIVRVEKSTHRLRKGAWIGFASGAGLAAVVGIGLCVEDDCAGWEPLVLAGFYGGLGAAAGVGIGAIVNEAKKHGDVLYDARRKTTTMSLAPILSPTRKGLAFSMTWR